MTLRTMHPIKLLALAILVGAGDIGRGHHHAHFQSKIRNRGRRARQLARAMAPASDLNGAQATRLARRGPKLAGLVVPAST